MTGPSADTEVLIVGAGLAGMTMAVALDRVGVPSLLIDRTEVAELAAPSRDGRTTAVALSGKRLFDALGLWDALDGEACPILDIRVSDGDSRLHLHYDHRDAAEATGGEPMGFIVENAALRAALAAAVRGSRRIRLRERETVAGLGRGPGGATVTLAAGGRIAARLVIAADGRESPLRGLAGIRTTRIPYGQTSIVCNATHERPHRNVAHERFLPGGPLAVLPIRGGPPGGGRSSIVWTERSPVARTMLALDDDAFADELTARFGPWLGRFHVDGRRWSHPLSLVQAERHVADRVALVGDAAHGIHPIAGQGFNLGLRDVAVLTELLAEAARLGLDPGSAVLLDRYQRRRGPDSTALVLATHGFDLLFSNDIAPLRLARRLGLAAVERLPALKRRFMLEAMGLGGGPAGSLPKLLEGQLP